ncbi:MAG: hypothetical protein ACREC6_09580, partial [Hyphomicrobiaceae bacterium]
LLGPVLWDDFNIRNDPIAVVRDMRITEAKCRTRIFVVTLCDIKMTDAAGSANTREFNYLIVGGLGDETVMPQRSQGPSPILTTNIGMDYLINRLVSFVAVMVCLAAIALGGLVAGVRSFAKTSESTVA